MHRLLRALLIASVLEVFLALSLQLVGIPAPGTASLGERLLAATQVLGLRAVERVGLCCAMAGAPTGVNTTLPFVALLVSVVVNTLGLGALIFWGSNIAWVVREIVADRGGGRRPQ